MMKTTAALLLSFLASAHAHGSGAWKDPNHWKEDGSFAGMRYISEGPPHSLTIVGSDDGKTWWNLKGSCSGPTMTKISIDFSPKGGPKDATATWAKGYDGKVKLTFGDGNAWEMMAPTSDSDLVPTPKRKCNCACGSSGQCGISCSSCDCEGCDA